MTVKFACAFAAFCAIVRSNIVFILNISHRMHLVKLIERFSLPVIMFSSAHTAQTATHN